jgi:A/G-specific adenine glycosylase
MFEKLVKWSLDKNQDLPWRSNRNLYSTLVSEIMLQQTTVQTVLNHYDRFLKKYPNVEALAQASEEQLTIDWKGLGYYRRARNLRSACIEIVEKYNGKIPLEYSKLIQIKGIGEYTANAILAIGGNKHALAIDANLERVLSRIYYIDIDKGPALHNKINELFSNQLICKEIYDIGARDFNEALMDLGRVYCKANNAYCELCPVNNNCMAFKKRDVLSLPRKKEKITNEKEVLKLLRVIVEKDGEFLVYTKNKNEWLSLQNEIPTYLVSATSETKQYPKLKMSIDFEMLPMIKTAITKYTIENYLLIFNEEEFKNLKSKRDYFYVAFKDVSNLSTASIKSLEFFGYKKQERR